jgi:hypothetical protein
LALSALDEDKPETGHEPATLRYSRTFRVLELGRIGKFSPEVLAESPGARVLRHVCQLKCRVVVAAVLPVDEYDAFLPP